MAVSWIVKKMDRKRSASAFMLALLVLILSCQAMGMSNVKELTTCLVRGGLTNITSPQNFTRYDYLLKYSLQNLRFTEGWVPKPALMVLPMSKEDVQSAVKCCVDLDWMICIRSGGHDYEGLSSWADVPFVILDLMNLDHVQVDVANETAWAEAGATLGQLYASIGSATDKLGFPAGDCSTVGLGGHISGGGIGFFYRMYGLAADMVIDALLVDPKGNLLDKDSMGEDVFWALRGGGGGSWGVVVAWKLKLVKVPPSLAVCQVTMEGESNVTDTFYKWQTVAREADSNISIYPWINANNSINSVSAHYQLIYLGSAAELVEKMNSSFPELGLEAGDCSTTTWFDKMNTGDLTDRFYDKRFFKHKTDFTTKPIPEEALRGLWKLLGDKGASLALAPLGGVMESVSSDFTPFPYRKEYMYLIQYGKYWTSPAGDHEYLDTVRRVYDYMTPFVSPEPRATYPSSIDLALGHAFNGTATVEEGMQWGLKYFQHNYFRLVKAKTQIDPTNVFRYAQSIPPATSSTAFPSLAKSMSVATS